MKNTPNNLFASGIHLPGGFGVGVSTFSSQTKAIKHYNIQIDLINGENIWNKQFPIMPVFSLFLGSGIFLKSIIACFCSDKWNNCLLLLLLLCSFISSSYPSSSSFSFYLFTFRCLLSVVCFCYLFVCFVLYCSFYLKSGKGKTDGFWNQIRRIDRKSLDQMDGCIQNN